MGLFSRLRLIAKANELVAQFGRLGLPQGPLATWIGAAVLILTQFLTTSGDLFPAAAQPYVAVLVAALTGVHTISALAWPSGSNWTVSAVWVIGMQAVGVAVQTLNAMFPLALPEWQPYIADCTQVLMSLQAVNSVYKQAR